MKLYEMHDKYLHMKAYSFDNKALILLFSIINVLDFFCGIFQQ